MTSSVGPDWILIFGTPVLRKKFYAFIACLVLLAIGAVTGGVLFYLDLKERSRSSSTEIPDEKGSALAANPAAENPESTMDPLERLLEFHVNSTNYKKLASLSVAGDYISDDLTVGISIMAREPDRFLQHLNYKDRRLSVGLVEGDLWYKQNSQLVEENDATLSKVNRVLMVMECAIPFLAWQYVGDTYRTHLKRHPDETWGDHAVGVLENNAFEGMTVFHYIDLETGSELTRFSRILVGEVDQIVEINFHPPASGLEYAFPAGYEVRINEKLICTANFNKYEFNKGLPSFLFYKR